MCRRERLNRVINTAEAVLGVRGVSLPRPLEKTTKPTWVWSGGGEAVHYSWGFGYSLQVPEHTLVLLASAGAMNIYKSCSIFKPALQCIASSKWQVNSSGEALREGCLFFLFCCFRLTFVSSEAYGTGLYFLPNGSQTHISICQTSHQSQPGFSDNQWYVRSSKCMFAIIVTRL